MKKILLWILLTLMLASCSAMEAPQQAMAMSTPYGVAVQSQPSAQITHPPTATPYVFQMKPTSTPQPTATPAGVNLTFGYGPQDFPADVNPLTGLPVLDPQALNRRPMAIKVTNFPRSVRPQWGLTLADHVYEYYLENLITRFIAIFYSKDASRVGPVRSGRFFDEHIVRMYKAIFTFASADYRVLDPWLESDLKNFLVIERESNCPPLCRIGPETQYNTLFADTQQLTQYIRDLTGDNGRQNLDGLRFEIATPYSSQLGYQLDISYSFVSYNHWEYDGASSRYLRFQESADAQDGVRNFLPLQDQLTGEQIAADNLIVLMIPHEYFVHTATTEMVKMDFMGQGKAFAFRDGYMYPIQWKRASQESLVTLTYNNGQPYPLKPGNVWFQVIGETSPSSMPADGAWAFEFRIP